MRTVVAPQPSPGHRGLVRRPVPWLFINLLSGGPRGAPQTTVYSSESVPITLIGLQGLVDTATQGASERRQRRREAGGGQGESSPDIIYWNIG